jgi:hypothetical protein
MVDLWFAGGSGFAVGVGEGEGESIMGSRSQVVALLLSASQEPG